MKITKTIDVSHLTDDEIASLKSASDIQKRLSDAKAIIAQIIKLMRDRGGGGNSFTPNHSFDMADAVERIAKVNGLL